MPRDYYDERQVIQEDLVTASKFFEKGIDELQDIANSVPLVYAEIKSEVDLIVLQAYIMQEKLKKLIRDIY